MKWIRKWAWLTQYTVRACGTVLVVHSMLFEKSLRSYSAIQLHSTTQESKSYFWNYVIDSVSADAEARRHRLLIFENKKCLQKWPYLRNTWLNHVVYKCSSLIVHIWSVLNILCVIAEYLKIDHNFDYTCIKPSFVIWNDEFYYLGHIRILELKPHIDFIKM